MGGLPWDYCVCTAHLVEAIPSLLEQIGVRLVEVPDSSHSSVAEANGVTWKTYKFDDTENGIDICFDRNVPDEVTVYVQNTTTLQPLYVHDALIIAGATKEQRPFRPRRTLRVSVDDAQNWPQRLREAKVRIQDSWPKSEEHTHYRFHTAIVRWRRRRYWVRSGVSISIPDRKLFGYLQFQPPRSFWKDIPDEDAAEQFIAHCSSCFANSVEVSTLQV